MNQGTSEAKANAGDPAGRRDFRILLILTNASSETGANTVGQARLQYAANTSILRVPDPVMFPEEFYLRALDKGFDGILVLSSGTDCPYDGAYKRLSDRISRVYGLMKERGIELARLKLTSVCTVCKGVYIKEIKDMEESLAKVMP